MARNLQEIIPAFFVGPNGQPLTPEQARTRQEIAESLLAQATDTSPTAGGWTSVLAKGVQGLAAGRQRHRAEEGLRLASEKDAEIAQALLGGIGSPSAPVSSSLPLGAAPVGAVSSQPLDPISQRVNDAHQTANMSDDKQAFIDALLPAAIEESKRTGVDPRIIVAQAAQETGWGRSAPGNNYFGIKSHGQGGGQQLKTHEYINGKRVNVTDSFRRFASPADSVRGYGDFILQNPRYKAFREAQGLDAQLAALGASGYATDPNYANSVGAIARSIQLPDLGAPEMPMMAYAPTGTPQAGALASAPFESAGLPQAPADPVIVATTPEEVLAAEIATGMVPNPLDLPENQVTVDSVDEGGAAPAAPVGGLSGNVGPSNSGIWGMGMDPNDPSTIPAMAGGTRDILPAGSPGIFPAAPGATAQVVAPSPSPHGGIPVGGGIHPAIVQALSSPYASPQTRQIAGMLLQQQMQAQDPMRAIEIEKARLELEAMRNPQPQTTAEMQNLMWRAQQAGLQPGTQQYAEFMLTGGKGPLVNVDVGNGEKFDSKFAESDAAALAAISEAGLSAQRNIARIDRLADLLSSVPTGAQANFKQIAANYGLSLGDDVSNIQAAQALINALVPEQRPPGSGPMSDADLELFKQSLPRIINQPGANALIINTMRGIAEYDAQGADIVQRLRRGEISRAEAFEALMSRKNPLEGLDDIISGGASGDMPSPKSPEEYNAIPSGTRYRAPDGSIRTKP